MTETTDINLLPLPEMDIYTLGSGVGLRDVCHTPVGFSQKKMSEYARANVENVVAQLQDEIEALRAEVGETKEVAVRAMRQRDAQYNRAYQLEDALREAIAMLLADYPETAKRLRAVLEQE